MGTVSIDIAGMRSLVQSVESAIGDIPGSKGSVSSNLTRVWLSSQPVSSADNVVSWLEGEVAGLRRRLAMAVAIEASTPGVQSFVQFDEGKISTNTPEQAKALADQVAKELKDGDIDAGTLQVLTDNKVDPYFASALAKQLSPEDISLIAQNMNGQRQEILRDSLREPGDLEEFDKRYSSMLDGLGQSLGLASQQTGADLKLPSDYNQNWLDAMTKEGVTRPGQASWLALVMSRGTWSKDFTVDITRGIYQHEKDLDMRGMWQMDAYPGGMGTYLGAVAPGGQQVYDPLALALQAVGRNPAAAMELMAHGDTSTVAVDGKDVTVNAFVKYLIAERKWPVDDGQGAKEAIAAGMTPTLGGSTDSMEVARFADAVVKFKTKEIEDRRDDGGWFSDIGHLVLDGLGLVPVFGEPADAINGIWYYAQGNVIDGSLSMASCIPVLGWVATGGKWTRKGVKALEAGSKLLTRDGRALESLDSFKLLAKADNIEPGVFKFDDLADLNRAANNPHPGVIYQYKGMQWSTDDLGRTALVRGKLKLGAGGRDPKLQRDIGNAPGTKDSDVGFHLIGDSLGGPTNKLNVLPGNGKPIDDGLANLNQGEYSKMERSLRGALKDGKDVEVELTPVYNTGNVSTRPDRFVVNTYVDGKFAPYDFINK